MQTNFGRAQFLQDANAKIKAIGAPEKERCQKMNIRKHEG